MAGSSDLAGLNEPPDAGPIASAAVKMKRPIRSGAMTPFQGARSSVATVQITITNRAVPISSSRSAPQLEMPSPGAVSSLSTAIPEYTAATTRTATKPPTSCAAQYGSSSRGGNFRAETRPRETAGLKWPPERCPSPPIASETPSPNAKAIPSVLIAPPPMSVETAIALKPRKKKRNVPSASAPRRRTSGGESIDAPPMAGDSFWAEEVTRPAGRREPFQQRRLHQHYSLRHDG